MYGWYPDEFGIGAGAYPPVGFNAPMLNNPTIQEQATCDGISEEFNTPCTGFAISNYPSNNTYININPPEHPSMMVARTRGNSEVRFSKSINIGTQPFNWFLKGHFSGTVQYNGIFLYAKNVANNHEWGIDFNVEGSNQAMRIYQNLNGSFSAFNQVSYNGLGDIYMGIHRKHNNELGFYASFGGITWTRLPWSLTPNTDVTEIGFWISGAQAYKWNTIMIDWVRFNWKYNFFDSMYS